MAYSVNFDPELRYYAITLEGRIDKNDIMGAMSTVRTHPEWFGGVNVLWDGRQIEEFLLETAHFAEIKDHYLKYVGQTGQGRAALVVQKSLYVPIADFFRLLLNSPVREIRTFVTFSEAAEWLNEA